MSEQPDRLEREINEILNKIEQFPTPEKRRARAARRTFRRFANTVATRQRAVMREISRISLSQLILLSFLMILGSFFFRSFGAIGQWVMFAGIALLVASVALMMFGGGKRGGATSRQWRGRTISYESDGLAQRLRRWFAARKRR